MVSLFHIIRCYLFSAVFTVCAGANVGVPNYVTTGQLSITDQTAYVGISFFKMFVQ
jgi:hypothetical protein